MGVIRWCIFYKSTLTLRISAYFKNITFLRLDTLRLDKLVCWRSAVKLSTRAWCVAYPWCASPRLHIKAYHANAMCIKNTLSVPDMKLCVSTCMPLSAFNICIKMNYSIALYHESKYWRNVIFIKTGVDAYIWHANMRAKIVICPWC